MDEQIKLLDCPFCGRKPETWTPTDALKEQAGELFIIQCDCGDDNLVVSLEANSQAEAAAAWNRRARADDTDVDFRRIAREEIDKYMLKVMDAD